MKKILILFILAVAFSCGDSGFESLPQDGKVATTDANGRVAHVPCPYYYAWFHTATGTTYVGLYERHENYKVMPFQPTSGLGSQANTFTFTIKNVGNMPMRYRHGPSDAWIALPINATHTFTKSVTAIPCLSTAQTYNYTIYAQATNCPAYAFGGQFRFKFQVTLTGVTSPHTIAGYAQTPPGELYGENKWVAETSYWDCGALPGCHNANCIPN